MRVLYYECFSGISGDMNLAAMLDLGVPADYLIDNLKKLNINKWNIKITSDSRNGIYGTKVEVIHSEDHHHRNYTNIKDIIENSTLSQEVKKTAISIFYKLANVEAIVHNTTIENIHFHEVGAVDAIIDIVGAAICYHYLKIDQVISTPLELGSGTVKCAHGIIPIPAPATMKILENIPVKSGTVNFEATTPTGAAIISTLSDKFTSQFSFTAEKTAYGIGHKKSEHPNLLRVSIGETEETQSTWQNELIKKIECNIDDMNPELYPYIMNKLLEAGAKDVYLSNVIMKKGRPGFILSVLTNSNYKAIKNILFTETSTLGIRECEIKRTILKREKKSIETPIGTISYKTAYISQNKTKSKAEYNDCKKAAEVNNLSLKEVYEKVSEFIK